MNNFDQNFDQYVCIGDSIQCDIEPFTVTARLHFDEDTTPYDADCYTETDIRRWKNNEWFYCGVVLSVSYNGTVIADHAASLWGVDCNLSDNNEYLRDVANELLPEALKTAFDEWKTKKSTYDFINDHIPVINVK